MGLAAFHLDEAVVQIERFGLIVNGAVNRSLSHRCRSRSRPVFERQAFQSESGSCRFDELFMEGQCTFHRIIERWRIKNRFGETDLIFSRHLIDRMAMEGLLRPLRGRGNEKLGIDCPSNSAAATISLRTSGSTRASIRSVFMVVSFRLHFKTFSAGSQLLSIRHRTLLENPQIRIHAR